MAIPDLELEFEEESEKPASDAIEIGGEISFGPDNGSSTKKEKLAEIERVKKRAASISHKTQSKVHSAASAEDDTNPNINIKKIMSSEPSAADIKFNDPSTAVESKKIAKKIEKTNPGVQVDKNNSKMKRKEAGGEAPVDLNDVRKARLQEKVTARDKTLPGAPSSQLLHEFKYSKDEEETEQSKLSNLDNLKISSAQKMTYDENFLKLQQEFESLKLKLNDIEKNADIKVAIANSKVSILANHLANARMLKYQLEQIMHKIFRKAPGLKPEVLMMKKYLDEFVHAIEASTSLT